MLEEIISTVDKKAKEEITLSKGIAVIIAVGAFVLGIIMGTAFTKAKVKKSAKVKAVEADEDFDPEEYLDSLMFEDEE